MVGSVKSALKRTTPSLFRCPETSSIAPSQTLIQYLVSCICKNNQTLRNIKLITRASQFIYPLLHLPDGKRPAADGNGRILRALEDFFGKLWRFVVDIMGKLGGFNVAGLALGRLAFEAFGRDTGEPADTVFSWPIVL